MNLTHLDLFSGIGGFALAAQWACFETIGFCEIEPYAQQVIIKNFGAVVADAEGGKSGKPSEWKRREDFSRRSSDRIRIKAARTMPRLHPDITKLNGADYRGVTLITGGFPCQPFSLAGKRRGKADDRHLWPEMLRVIAEARPAWVLGENVAGIINMELDSVLAEMEAIGYAAWPLVIPACAVDARHRRDRVWIVANDASQGQGNDSQMQAGRELAGRDSIGGCGCDDADAEQHRYQESRKAGHSWPANQLEHGGEQSVGEVRLIKSQFCRMAHGLSQGLDETGQFCQWPEENPQVPRIATGIQNRAHRLKGLGNAIVPQVAYQILKEIAKLCQTKP